MTERNKFEVGTATTRFEFGVRCDHPIQRLGVFGLDLLAVAIIPPIIHLFPRPLRDVKNVVAEHRHAFIEADLDAGDRGPISVTATMPMITPSAVSMERVMFERICATAIFQLSVNS